MAVVRYTENQMRTFVNIHTGEASAEQAGEKEQVLFAKLGSTSRC